MADIAERSPREARRARVPVRLRHRHRVRHRCRPASNEDVDPADLGEEERAGVAARVAAQGARALARDPTEPSRAGRTSTYPPIDYQAIIYYSAPKQRRQLDEPRRGRSRSCCATYEKLGIPLHEQKRLAGVAVDAVFDSVSVATTFKAKLGEAGHHLLLVLRGGAEASRAGAQVPRLGGARTATTSSRRSTRRSSPTAPSATSRRACAARWSSRPTSASTRPSTGQFERTLIVADEGAYVSATSRAAPRRMRDENQLHAAVVELVALDDATIKYSTVQNWYPGDKDGKGGIYNFVTKRGDCRGKRSKISWTQVETGSAITWKYPSCILQGDDSVGEFYSVALTNNHQQADTGTKMIHIGKNTQQHDRLEGHLGRARPEHVPRPGARSQQGATGARNYSQCDSLLLGDECGAHTFPYIEVKNPTAQVEHEASTSKIGEDQLFYCQQRGISDEDAVSMIVNGFCKEVFQRAADGVRGRGAEAARRVSSKAASAERRSDADARDPRTCTPRVGEQRRSCRGIDLDGARRRGARDHGPERLGQEHARARARRARPGYEVTQGAVLYDGQRPARAGARGARARGHLPRLPVPGRDPRRRATCYFLKAGAQRDAQAPRRARARRDGLPRARAREDEAASRWTRRSCTRAVNEGFSGGEKKRNEIFQMAMLEPRARDPRRDRLGPRHRRAARRRRRRERAAQPGARDARDHPLPAAARLHRARLRPRARRAAGSCAPAARSSRSSSRRRATTGSRGAAAR